MSDDNVVRWFLMAGSAALLGASLVIVVYYTTQWYRRWRAGLPGTVPLRVIMTVLSYDLLLVSSVAGQISQFDKNAGLSWRVFLVVPSVLIGLGVLGVILFTDRGTRNDEKIL